MMKVVLLLLVSSFLCVTPSEAGEHNFTCPQTIEAVDGDDVTLHCGLVPRFDLSASTLDVARERDDHGNYDDVYSYRNGKDHLDDQMDRYRGRTTLNHEDLIRGIVTLKISSVNQSDSGNYIVFLKNLQAHSVINITVVPKDQPNGTKRNDSTSGPPGEEKTESNHRGGSATEESVWKIVLASVFGAVVVGVGVLLLVKCGVIPKLQTALQHFIISGIEQLGICKKTKEAETRLNNATKKCARTQTTEEGGDPDSAEELGELMVPDDTQSSPQS